MSKDCKFQSKAATCVSIYKDCRSPHFLKTCPYDSYDECNFGLPKDGRK